MSLVHRQNNIMTHTLENGCRHLNIFTPKIQSCDIKYGFYSEKLFFID